MKPVFLVALACASLGGNAAFLPDFLAGTRFENTQQVVFDKWGPTTDKLTRFLDSWDATASKPTKASKTPKPFKTPINQKNDWVSGLTQYISQQGESLISAVWKETVSQFPKQMSQLTLKTRPKPASQNLGKFDFHVSDTRFPKHQLRVKLTPEDLGIDSVRQYTGYLDVDEEEDKHFFYWFFESRNDPKNDPVILWLNGGPGCSSLTGLLFELGPSSITAKLLPKSNPYSWNTNASVIFLDQPVNVGFSYSSKEVRSTVAAGKDVYAFLELFFKKFPEYLHLDFHIAGESYAGHYIPDFSTEILSHPERSFNFKSVMIGNGITDPLTQYAFYRPMACGEGGEPSVLSPEECNSMDETIPNCQRLIEACYNSGSVFACVPASVYCENSQTSAFTKTGRNVYDMRTTCKGGDLCYEELQYIDDYLNQPEVLAKLGVETEAYQSCDNEVGRNFFLTGDLMRPFHTNVAQMLEQGVSVLIYAGDKDFICNWLGNQAWVDKLPWSGHDQFEKLPIRKWTVDGKAAGEVKNYGNLTFLRVFGAGHMVPFNQPQNSLEMVNRWIAGEHAL